MHEQASSSASVQEEFIGRAPQLTTLHASLEAAWQGRGHVAVLVGEPGIGKTRLAGELASAARERGAQVLVGRCHEGGGAPPFWPWAQALRTYVQSSDPAHLRQDMGPGAADILQVMPDVGVALPAEAPAAPAGEAGHARFRCFASVTQFLRNSSRRQLLVVVLDDLHWADAPSLQLLQFVAREIADAPLLIVGTSREAERDRNPLVAQTLAEVTRLPGNKTILLRGLSHTEIEDFLARTAKVALAPSLVTHLAGITEGNPFFLQEIVQLLLAEGRVNNGEFGATWSLPLPQGVRSVIERRLEQVSGECRELLTVAAVIGREFGVPEVEAVADTLQPPLTSAAVDRLIEEAEAARLVTFAPGDDERYSFVHALIRETLYAAIPTGRRLRLHREVGEALERLYGITPAFDQRLEGLAYHFFMAARGRGDVAKALAYAQRAADHSMRVLAYEEAIVHYERALHLLARTAANEEPRCDLLLALGTAQRRAGQMSRARATFLQAADLARRIPSPERLAAAALGHSLLVLTPQSIDRAEIDLLKEVLATLAPADSSLRVRVLACLAMELKYQDPEAEVTFSLEALHMARRLNDAVALATALHARLYALWTPDALEERVRAAAELAATGKVTGDKELELLGYHWQVTNFLEQGDRDALDRAVVAHTRLAAEIRQPLHLVYNSSFQGARLILAGQFAEAAAVGRRTQDLCDRAQLPVQKEVGGFIKVSAIAMLQGRPEALEQLLARREQVIRLYPLFPYIFALLLTQKGRLTEAQELIAPMSPAELRQLP